MPPACPGPRGGHLPATLALPGCRALHCSYDHSPQPAQVVEYWGAPLPVPLGVLSVRAVEEGEEPRPEATAVWQEPQKLPPRANRCRRPQATAVSRMLMLFLLVGQTLIPRGLCSRAKGGLRTPEPPSAGRAPKEAALQPPAHSPFPSQPAFPCLPQTSPGVAWCLPG